MVWSFVYYIVKCTTYFILLIIEILIHILNMIFNICYDYFNKISGEFLIFFLILFIGGSMFFIFGDILVMFFFISLNLILFIKEKFVKKPDNNL